MPADTLTIRQIEPPGPGQPMSTLVLSGRCAPLRPLTWGGEQRRSVTWMEGTPRAAVRLAGAEESTTTFKFRWMSRLMGDGAAKFGIGGALDAIDSANDLEALVQQLRRDPALVMVTWRGRQVVGILASVSASAGYEEEWDVSVDFQPVGGPEAGSVWDAELALGPEPLSLAEKLLATLDNGLTSVEQATTWAEDALELVGARVGDVRAVLSRIYRDARSIRLLPQSAAGVAKQMAAGLQQLFTTSAYVRDTIVPAPNLAQTDDARMQILAAAYLGETDRAVRRARHEGALARRSFRPEADILRTHIAVAGETIWSVSFLYFGTIEYADLIAERNNLRSPELFAGAKIVIPLPPGGRRG